MVVQHSGDAAGKVLEQLEKLMLWARMGFKARKLSVVVRQGFVDHVHKFELGGEVVPLLVEPPLKSLGTWYMVELNDVGRVEEVWGSF